MEKTRSLLELYGSLDKAVSESDDPQIAAAVDELLPGASANKGWYREIEHFFFSQHSGGARDEADPIEALRRIAQRGAKLSDYQKLRLLYGVAALARVQSVPASGPLPHVKTGDMREALVGALAHLRPAKTSYGKSKDKFDKELDEFLGQLSTSTGKRAWPRVTRQLADKDWIAPTVADVPLCKTAVVTVDGVECVVVDTDFGSDTLSLNRVKAVADPLNWDQNYHDFFCQIKQLLPARTDGWGRFLETVGFCGEERAEDVLKLVTDLKYYKSTPSTTEANLDYDLDDPTPGQGDGQVLVDRGFINMRATTEDPEQPGVRVRTRKVVHIRDIRPWAQARLVCITGYGTASREFLLGAAQNPPKDAEPWDAPVTAPDTTEQGTTGTAQPTSYIATAAVKLWSDCVEHVMERNLDLSKKWMAGRLNLNDLANYSKDVGGLLLGAPWEFLETMSRPGHPSSKSNDTP